MPRSAFLVSRLSVIDHADVERVAHQHRRDDLDLAAEVRHAGAVDEPRLHDQPLGEAEGEGARRRLALEDRRAATYSMSIEERLVEAAEVDEGADVRLRHRAPQRLVGGAHLVLLVRQSLRDPRHLPGWDVIGVRPRRDRRGAPRDCRRARRRAPSRTMSPGLEHVAASRDGQRHGGVLLDEQDGHALPVDGLHGLEDLLHEDRRQPHRRLVEQQQPRPGHEGARPMASICCSPPESVPATWRPPLLQPREDREDPVHVLADAGSERVNAPISRFSSTVKRLKMRRPSGAWVMPRRTMACEAHADQRAALEDDVAPGARRASRRSPGAWSSCRRRCCRGGRRPRPCATAKDTPLSARISP